MAKAKLAAPVIPSEDEAIVVTKEGLKALEEELKHLKTVRRKEIAQRLKEAIGYGDLSENSEYEEAKNEQAFVEGRILALEEQLKKAKVVDERQHSKKMVEIGTKVKIRNSKKKSEELEFTLVGSTESDVLNGRISNESPFGQALMGSKVGDKVRVEAPSGIMEYEVLKLA